MSRVSRLVIKQSQALGLQLLQIWQLFLDPACIVYLVVKQAAQVASYICVKGLRLGRGESTWTCPGSRGVRGV